MLCVPDAILATNLSCPISYELTIVPTQYLIGSPEPERAIASNTTFVLTSMIVLLRLCILQRGAVLREWSGLFYLDAIQERTRRLFIFTPFKHPEDHVPVHWKLRSFGENGSFAQNFPSNQPNIPSVHLNSRGNPRFCTTPFAPVTIA